MSDQGSSVRAGDIREGDYIFNPDAEWPFRWLWVRGVSPWVAANGETWVKIETISWSTVKHPDEAVLVQRAIRDAEGG